MSNAYISPSEIDRRTGVSYDSGVRSTRPRTTIGVRTPAEIDRQMGVSYTDAPYQSPYDRPRTTINANETYPLMMPLPVRTSPTDPLAGLGPGATTGQIMDFVAENYPGMIGFFNSNPEIRNKLIEAARWGWSPAKLDAEVKGTNWYRSTAYQARDFELLEAQDPASAKAQVASVAASIQNSARTMGLGLSGGQIAGLAWQAARNGWTDAQTVDALLSGLNWNMVEGGTLSANVDDIKAMAGDYLVNLSDSTARGYAARMASGEYTLEGVRAILQKQSRARFNWMADLIDQGITPKDYLAPVRDVIANTLEVAPESINLMSPQWMSLVERRDRESGQLRAATLNEALLSARGTNAYPDTQGAQELSAGMLSLVQEAFGL